MLHGKGNGLANWYYYFSEGKVSLKMFGLADVAQEKPEGGKPERDKSNNVVPTETIMVASLDENMRFSGVDGYELSKVVISGHQKMYEDILKKREEEPVIRAGFSLVNPACPNVAPSRRRIHNG